MATPLKFYHYKKSLLSTESFCADHVKLDGYISGAMPKHESDNISRHYVGQNDEGITVSVFCLCASELRTDDPDDAGNRDDSLPQNMDWPTIRIGRFVVHKNYRGNGSGKQTLTKAIELFIDVSKTIGVVGLTVDAKDEMVETKNGLKPVFEFYEKFGFKKLSQTPKNGAYPMILHLNTIRKIYPSLFENPV